MTDKKVIIGDIDVSGCMFYKGYCRIATLCDYPRHLCEATPNCYFKQHARTEKKLQAKEQENEKLKDRNQYLINTYCHFKNEIKKYKKSVHKYKVVLQDKLKRMYLSRREFFREINSVPLRIACKGEGFKNALNNFNNTIQMINNEVKGSE